MKTFTLVTLTAMTLMLSGCKDESVDFGGNGDGGDHRRKRAIWSCPR